MRILLSGLFLLVGISLSLAQTADEFEELALKKLEQKDYKYALELIDKALALDDKNEWYYISKSDIQFQLTGPLESIKTLKEGLIKNERKSQLYNRLGTYYDSGGMSDSSILMYDKAIEYAETDTLKNYFISNRGAAKTGMRDFEGAIHDFETALLFDPNNLGALNNVATCYAELNMIEKSIRNLKRIIRLDSTFAGAYGNLGFIYSKLDSFDLAVANFNKALQLDCRDALGYNNRGYVYYKIGDYQSALRDVYHSINLYPSNSYAYRNLALVYIAQGNMKEACTALGYALNYGFEGRYGSEVSELLKQYCR
ncbi:MAG TPA: tetratricopeptide repeat protein [Bacteroidia bacterium]|jgi:tetratricopeptide (TPR) repeat protein|nr:tetratricopeptide repeat protein [Bacteroidia bacterium]